MNMKMNIFVKTCKEKYRGVLILSVFLFFLALYACVMFSSLGDEMLSGFDEMFQNPAFKAFGKSVTSLSTLEGLLTVELYQWGMEILLAGFAIFFAAGFISGEVESKTIDVLLANPVSRTRILLEKYLALVVMLVLVNVALFIGVAGGAFYIGEALDIKWVVYAHIFSMPYLLVVGSYSTLLSVIFDDSRRTSYVGFGILMGSFIINSLSITSQKYAQINRITLFYYYDVGKILVLHEVNWGHTLFLCALAVLFLVIAVIWFKRKDIAVA
jgi:ABC-2 type transport system permease protein